MVALVFGRNEGAPYHPLAAVLPELTSCLEGQFEVKSSDRGESLLALGLGGIDLVVGLDDRWTEALDARWLAAVEQWVREGGCLLLVHNGICWARDRRWRRLAGGRFVGHGPAKELTFRRRDSGDQWTLFEEPYRFSVPWLSGNKVWADYEDEGKRWPAFWSRKVGRGTIAYALPGHDQAVFQHPGYRSWLAEWSASLSRKEYPGK